MNILSTARLSLRCFKAQDISFLYELLGDAKVMEFSDGVLTKAQVQLWLSNYLEQYDNRGYGPWAVLNNHQQLLGYCGLFYFADINGNSEVEIGYRLKSQYWRQGFATEAALAVRDYAFTELGQHRLVAIIEPNNKASIKVANKIGMAYEADIMFKHYSHPDHLYAIER